MRAVVVCLALGAPVLPAPVAAGELTLDAALARARAANATLVAAAAELEAARGRRVQAGLLPANPVLSGDMARHSDPTTSQIDRGVALAQEIEVGGQRGLRVAGADHDVARADFLLADRRRVVDADVRRAFADVVASIRRRRLAEASVAIAARIVEATGRRARAGDVAALDVRLAAIERARADQALDVATAEQAAAIARLAAVLNLPPDEDVGVVDDPYEPAALAPEVELVARALAARPDLAAAREEAARLDSEAHLARRRGLVPNPVVRGFYRQELFDERIAGGEVSVPLPIWNREQGTQAALLAGASAAAAEVDRLTRAIPREVALAVARHRLATTAWQRARSDTLPGVVAARELLERGDVAGYIGVPEQLVQQDRLIQAEAASIDAWRALRMADADVIEAVGGALP